MLRRKFAFHIGTVTAAVYFAAVSGAHAKTIDDLINTINNSIIQPVTVLLEILATLLFLYGVVQYIMNAANADKREEGTRHMLWGIVGLLIIVSVNAIITILRNFFA